MKKLTTIIGVLALALCATAATLDVTTTLPLNATAATNDQAFTVGGAPVEFVSVLNSATFSNTVTITQYDGGVTGATLYSGTLTAGAAATVYPARWIVNSGVENVVTGDVIMVLGTVASNSAPYTVTGVRITVTSASGATNTTTGPVRAFIQSVVR